MPHPKLIIADADGTLIEKGSIKSFPASLGKAIRALRMQGISFMIASGRPYSFLKELHRLKLLIVLGFQIFPLNF